MITPEFFWGFAIGAVTALFISTVFFSVKYHDLYEKGEKQSVELWNCEQKAAHLEAEANPLLWVDSSDVKVRQRGSERLYDRHAELVQPGSEVIRITEDDVPDA